MPGLFYCLGHDEVCTAVERAMVECGWSRADAVERADAVFTYFTHAGALEDAYFETDGLVKTAREDALLIDLSPSAPSFARELAAVAAVNDLRFVEAPVVVCDPAAVDALSPENLTCYIAADDDSVLDAAEPLLNAIADTVVRVGASGAAQLAKGVCTAQISSQVLAAVESAALRASSGVAAADMVLPAQSDLIGDLLAAIDAEAFEGSYTIEMMMADVVAAMTAADDANLILPQLEATMHLLEVLAVIGGADMAPAALSLLYRDEPTCAAHGLDWTRAEGLFGDAGHDHDHSHGFDDDDYGYDGYEDDDAFGFSGGFGGYSSN